MVKNGNFLPGTQDLKDEFTFLAYEASLANGPSLGSQNLADEHTFLADEPPFANGSLLLTSSG